MILSQRLETRCISKALRDQEARCDRELVFLRWRPAMNILEKTGESGLLERFLKIFVSIDRLEQLRL